MSRTSRTIVTLLAVIFARASDIATTLHFNFSNIPAALSLNSPLTEEANPVLAITGRGARTLVLTNCVVVALFLLLPLWIYWRCPVRKSSPMPGNLQEFVSLQLWRRILSKSEFYRALFFGLPKDGLQLIRFFGFSICWTIVFTSLMGAFTWWATHDWHWTAYENLRDKLVIWNYPILEVSGSVVAFCVAGYAFFRIDFIEFSNRYSRDSFPPSKDESAG